jgi:hypothetical protein
MQLQSTPVRQDVLSGAAIKRGDATFTAVAGQTLTIETSLNGAEILSEECPAGKQWSGRVVVEITETDA